LFAFFILIENSLGDFTFFLNLSFELHFKPKLS